MRNSEHSSVRNCGRGTSLPWRSKEWFLVVFGHPSSLVIGWKSETMKQESKKCTAELRRKQRRLNNCRLIVWKRSCKLKGKMRRIMHQQHCHSPLVESSLLNSTIMIMRSSSGATSSPFGSPLAQSSCMPLFRCGRLDWHGLPRFPCRYALGSNQPAPTSHGEVKYKLNN